MTEQEVQDFLNNAFQIWFTPEIERRKSAGTLPVSLNLFAAQVILDMDFDRPIVRFNDEVHGLMKAVAARAIQAGEQVLMSDLTDIAEFSLTDEFPNAGHLTLILHGNIWRIFFDFRRNATRVHTQLDSVDQFLKAARFCVDSKLPIPAVDNLYDAVQLMAKCYLLILPDKKVLVAKSHGFIEASFNHRGKLGLVPPSSVTLLNRLSELRPKTRYSTKPVPPDDQELVRLQQQAEQMRSELEATRPRRLAP